MLSLAVLFLHASALNVRSADAPKATSELEKFKRTYALADGQVLKRIAPPFPEFRLAYYKHVYQREPNFVVNCQFIRWKNGQFGEWGASIAGVQQGMEQGVEFRNVLASVTGLRSQFMKGDAADLSTLVSGDFVIREGTSSEQLVPRLSEILNREMKLPVSLSFGNSVRRVFEVKGEYKFIPRPGATSQAITIGTSANYLEGGGGGGGGSGTLDEFLNWMGCVVAHPLISEVKNPPARVSWWVQAKQPMNELEVQECLRKITEQTGLTFTPKARKIRVLLVEHMK